jgi:hypothetical protein
MNDDVIAVAALLLVIIVVGEYGLRLARRERLQRRYRHRGGR